MSSNQALHIVATECRSEQEARFNKWYNEIHVPMLFKFGGMKKVTRYKKLDDNKEHATYLALYEFESKEALADFTESPERNAAREEMKESWKDGGFELKWTAPYEAIKTWER